MCWPFRLSKMLLLTSKPLSHRSRGLTLISTVGLLQWGLALCTLGKRRPSCGENTNFYRPSPFYSLGSPWTREDHFDCGYVSSFCSIRWIPRECNRADRCLCRWARRVNWRENVPLYIYTKYHLIGWLHSVRRTAVLLRTCFLLLIQAYLWVPFALNQIINIAAKVMQ